MSATPPPRYIRITKPHARERWEAGLPIVLCPCKFYPGGPFSAGMLVFPKNYRGGGRDSFDMGIREFCCYNANSSETGRYPHYYITSDMDPEPLQMIVREKVREARRRERGRA